MCDCYLCPRQKKIVQEIKKIDYDGLQYKKRIKIEIRESIKASRTEP